MNNTSFNNYKNGNKKNVYQKYDPKDLFFFNKMNTSITKTKDYTV